MGKIIAADGTWQFDDTNHTTNPIGTGTLVEGQASYTFEDEFLDIIAVKVLEKNTGYYVLLKPLDESELGMSVEEYFGGLTGFPEYYDKIGDTIKLYPTPTATYVTLASGLKVHFQRTAHLFTASDTTAEPGIASPFHYLIPYMASVPYCMAYKKDRVALYEKKIDDGIREMLKYYARREKDVRSVMGMETINFR